LPEVRLTNGKVALVDEDDYERVVAVGKRSEENGYAVRQIRIGGRKGLAKRIRIVTKSENQRGRSRNANKKSSFYKVSSMILLHAASDLGG
jgi:hypothetical protein